MIGLDVTIVGKQAIQNLNAIQKIIVLPGRSCNLRLMQLQQVNKI